MSFITVAGEQLIAQKQGNSEVLNITHFVLANIAGLGAEPVDRIEAMPDVGDIVDTRAVTSFGYVNENQVVYSLVLDSTVGDYTFNWVGLKAEGGELVAVAYIPPQIKTATAGGVPGNNLTRNFLLAFSGAMATTAITVPAETWQIDFTWRLLEIDQRERLSNFDIYGQGAFFENGFKVEYVSGNTYKMKAGLGYVGGIRCELLADVQITVASPPKGIWVDASLQGDINDMTDVIAFAASATELADYFDGLDIEHFVFKIADIPSVGVVTDLRPIAPLYLRRDDIVPQAEAQAGTATTPRAWTAQRVKQAIDALIVAATETIQGKVELATAAETITGTDNTRAVHPAGLKSALDNLPVSTETVQGKVELATAAETITGTDNTRAVHPAGLKAAINAFPVASETVQGKVELATAAETQTGTDNSRAVHPAGLKAYIDSLVKGWLINYYRTEFTSFYDVTSASWVSLPGFYITVSVNKAPVTADVFARIQAHFNQGNNPAFARILLYGGEYGSGTVIDKCLEEGLSSYTISQSFILKRRINLAQNVNYTFQIQMRNSTDSPGQNTRINASDESQNSNLTEALSMMDIGLYKA